MEYVITIIIIVTYVFFRLKNVVLKSITLRLMSGLCYVADLKIWVAWCHLAKLQETGCLNQSLIDRLQRVIQLLDQQS